MAKQYTPPAKTVDESPAARQFVIRHDGYRNPVTKEVTQRRICYVTLRATDQAEVPTPAVWLADALTPEEETQLDAILAKLVEAATSGSEFKTT